MNPSNFNFSITGAIKNSWSIFKANPWFYIVPSFVIIFINIAFNLLQGKDHAVNFIITVLVTICNIIWGYLWLSISLDSVDNKTERLNLKSLNLHLPNIKQTISIFLVSLVAGILSIIGFIFLIIPGIYLSVKFSMAKLAYVDRKEGVRDSLKHSWNIVKGDIFWTVILTMIASGFVSFVGVLLLGVGLFVAYPISMLLIAHLYRAINKHYMDSQSVASQPAEIPAHTS